MTTTRLITCHSILQLDARHPVGSRALIDAQQMHRLVMSGFRGWVPDGERDARAQLGVLSTWTLDLKADILLVVVQSRVKPDWSGIPDTALRTPIDVQQIDQPIRRGDTYGFRTVVSPMSSRRDLKQKNEVVIKKLPHNRPDQVRAWFKDRLQPEGEPAAVTNGTRKLGADTDPATTAIRMLPPVTTDAHQGLKITRAEIKGTLTVTDPEAFLGVLTQGLGPARAYSCGLVLTRPA
ncbi:type I-E CRISPR-associated protein Cas6/Cse3/CasE [Kitasatospora kifunensis]|uniref:CRISPR system Cascade subunit CasE n=1 Tax=Kitasatospora kifunensis TaxID=58351 RepID=A0A7W7RBB5_KITKI|nr:type I-E CRISPR-associated protein Cas6/Cse3/CasE [Kitasatospora kifunensis]MBB4928847.1 CRISPR system Cascade subunit CasE [Kitasatospora kifunensis]